MSLNYKTNEWQKYQTKIASDLVLSLFVEFIIKLTKKNSSRVRFRLEVKTNFFGLSISIFINFRRNINSMIWSYFDINVWCMDSVVSRSN